MQLKFVVIMFNGVSLFFNFGIDCFVDLLLILFELLDGIEVYKFLFFYMDVEVVGGMVNLCLCRVVDELKMIVKFFGGVNILNDDFCDYKGVLQISDCLFVDKWLGFVFQGGVECFNCGGDIQMNCWCCGLINIEMGVIEILGDQFCLEDWQEICCCYNISLLLDYDLDKYDFIFFGLYSCMECDCFMMEECFLLLELGIEYWGWGIDNQFDFYLLLFIGEYILGLLLVDWMVFSLEIKGEIFYDFFMQFVNNSQVFDFDLDVNG